MLDSESPRWSVLYYGPWKLPHKQPNTVNKTFPASQPPPPRLFRLVSLSRHSSLSPKETAFFISLHKSCHSWHKQRKGQMSALLFSRCFSDIPNMSFKYNRAASRASKGDIIQGLPISISPTLSTSTRPLSFYVSMSEFLHLPLHTSPSLHPASLCAGAWTVSAACNTNYCTVLRSREQRGEITRSEHDSLHRLLSCVIGCCLWKF